MDCKVTFKYDGNNKELKILNTYIKEIKYNISIPKINGENKITKGNAIEITGRLAEIESEKDCEREENLLSWTTEQINDIFNYYRNIELEIRHKDEIVRKNKFYGA